MHILKLLAISLVSFALVACQNTGFTGGHGGDPLRNEAGNINKQNIGTLLGAAGGAAIGSNVGKGKGRVAGIAAGTLLGAMVGSSIGRSLDQADVAYHRQSAHVALESTPTGNTVTWRNPDSGNSGTVTPVRTYERGSGQYCREYKQTILVGGRTQDGYGTACRMPDGSWEIQ